MFPVFCVLLLGEPRHVLDPQVIAAKEAAVAAHIADRQLLAHVGQVAPLRGEEAQLHAVGGVRSGVLELRPAFVLTMCAFIFVHQRYQLTERMS